MGFDPDSCISTLMQRKLLAESVAGYKIPTLGISEAFKYAPPALAGVLVAMFALERIRALARGSEVSS